MEDPRIALVVDHPQRDLGGIVLTALALCARGATCHLVPANIAPREIWALAPDLVVLNYFRRSNEPMAAAMRASGIRIALLDTEGAVWEDFESYRELLWNDAGLLRSASVACTWGEWLAKETIAHGVFDPSQVRITGCPRFDLYHADWQPAVLGPAPRLQGASVDGARPRRVLLNTNFSTVNPRFASLSAKIHTSKHNFGWAPERITEIIAAEGEGMAGMIALARTLADDFPDDEIVVRPHPFEDPEPYRRALAGAANVRIVAEGSVEPLILSADVVVQRSCTTAIESGIAGRPTLSPRWVTAAFEMPVAEAVSVPCADYAALRDTVRAVLDGDFVLPAAVAEAIARMTREYFHVLDGNAHQRVADAVLGVLQGPRTVDVAACTRLLYHFAGDQPRPAPVVAAGHVRRALRLTPDFSFRQLRRVPEQRWPRTAKYFGADGVQRLADTIGALGRARAEGFGPVEVGLARERGECRDGYHGHSVTVAPAPVAAGVGASR
ncbi:MAG: surface carbohydrate biosynthesis protein [Gemmatirosa sp.]